MEFSFEVPGGDVALAARRAEKLATLQRGAAERAATAAAAAAAAVAAAASAGTADGDSGAVAARVEALHSTAVSCAAMAARAATDAAVLADSVRASAAAAATEATVAAAQTTLNEGVEHRWLPTYDARKVQSLLDAALSDAAALRSSAAPRRRFVFSRRNEAQSAAAAASSPTAAAIPEPAPAALAAVSSSASMPAPWCEDEFTVAGHADSLVWLQPCPASALASGAAPPPPTVTTVPLFSVAATMAAAVLPPVGGAPASDVRLLNLTGCLVLLSDATRALRVDGLARCVIVCAEPTAGSVLLHNCTDCVFFLTSRQVRVHTSARCTFYVAVSSRPIIEHCNSLTFAPNAIWSSGAATSLSRASLPNIHAAPATVSGSGVPPLPNRAFALPPPFAGVHAAWATVDDFDWLRIQDSPNWAPVRAVADLPSDLAAACPPEIALAMGAAAQTLNLRLCYDTPGLVAIGAALAAAATAHAVDSTVTPVPTSRAAAVESGDEL